MAEKMVYVHSRSRNHEVACGHLGDQRTYQVVDHIFECEEPDALALFKHWDFDDRFGGQFRMPIENYRPATDEEINAFLAKYPDMEAKRNASLAQSLAKQRADLQAQIDELNGKLAAIEPDALSVSTDEESKPKKSKATPSKPKPTEEEPS